MLVLYVYNVAHCALADVAHCILLYYFTPMLLICNYIVIYYITIIIYDLYIIILYTIVRL